MCADLRRATRGAQRLQLSGPLGIAGPDDQGRRAAAERTADSALPASEILVSACLQVLLRRGSRAPPARPRLRVERRGLSGNSLGSGGKTPSGRSGTRPARARQPLRARFVGRELQQLALSRSSFRSAESLCRRTRREMIARKSANETGSRASSRKRDQIEPGAQFCPPVPRRITTCGGRGLVALECPLDAATACLFPDLDFLAGQRTVLGADDDELFAFLVESAGCRADSGDQENFGWNRGSAGRGSRLDAAKYPSVTLSGVWRVSQGRFAAPRSLDANSPAQRGIDGLRGTKAAATIPGSRSTEPPTRARSRLCVLPAHPPEKSYFRPHFRRRAARVQTVFIAFPLMRSRKSSADDAHRASAILWATADQATR